MAESSNSGSSRGCGCISICLTAIFLFALIFGVTVGGKHYQMSCDCNRGVVVE